MPLQWWVAPCLVLLALDGVMATMGLSNNLPTKRKGVGSETLEGLEQT